MSQPPAALAASVVIPTRNRSEKLSMVVGAVLSDPATTEVVVVDDGSTDGTAEVVARLAADDGRVTCVQSGGIGAAAARQAGLEASTGDIVVMLDDDVVAGADLVSGHCRHHEEADDPKLAVVGYMPTRVPEPRRPGQFATRFYAEEYQAHVAAWERGQRSVVETLWSGNMSMRREAWLGVGVHDPTFPQVNHNDRDLGLRLAAHGVTGVFDRSLTSVHAHDRTIGQFRRDAFKQGVGRCLIAHRHGTGFDPGSLSADLPAALRTAVHLSDLPFVGGLLAAGLAMSARLSGRAHAWQVEDACARLLRRVELHRGAMSALRRAPSTAGPT